MRKICMGLLVMVALCAQARAQTLTTIFRFNGLDGAAPIWQPVADGQGNLYGTTQWGGAVLGCSCGTIYKFTPGVSRSFATLHTFVDGKDGAVPEAGLTYDASADMLYGTTTQGGSSGGGIIFSYNLATDTFAPLYSFPVFSYPQKLTLGSDGTLYGTMETAGGTAVFTLNPGTGSLTILHVLSAAEGARAAGSLVFGKAGKLFGMTTNGGSASGNGPCSDPGCGTVYRLDPVSGAVQVIYNFTEFLRQLALTVDDQKNLYVTTSGGGYHQSGEILKLTANVGEPYTVSTLLQFGSVEAGGYPAAGLSFDSVKQVLYGTTSQGGTGGQGVLFQIYPDGSGFTVLHAFAGGSDGANPNDGILVSLGQLYGETLGTVIGTGSPKYCQGPCGTLFKYPRF